MEPPAPIVPASTPDSIHGLASALVGWYEAYAGSFSGADGILPPMLQLKFDHSRRVANETREIAIELGWDDASVRLADVAGLLHDTGRYVQFTRFATFLDPASVDHGEAGWEAASTCEILGAAPPGIRHPLLDSIRYHNRRQVPAHLPPASSLPLLRLVRDADKIDILHVVNETVRTRRYEVFPEILLHIRIEGDPNPVLVREILETRGGSYQNVKTLADMGLMRLCWAYDINYRPSLQRILDRGMFDEIRAQLPGTPDIRRILDDIDAHIADRLSRSDPVPAPDWSA